MFTRVDKPPTIEYVKNFETPRIHIWAHALDKMKQYVTQCNSEISWLGVVERGEWDEYVIKDVMLVKQTVTGCSADMCETALNDLGVELVQTNQSELFNKIRMWGHSHVNMEVFASKTDDDTFEDFYTTSDYFIRIIVNKKGDMRLDFIDCEKGIKYMNLDWTVIKRDEEERVERVLEAFKKWKTELEASIAQEVKEEITKNIQNKGYTYSTGYEYAQPTRFPTYAPAKNVYDEMAEAVKKNTTQEEMPLIRLNWGATKRYVRADDIFYDAEILDIVETAQSYEDLPTLCEAWPEFNDYDTDDWIRLYETLNTAYDVLIFSEEYNG